MYDKIVKIISQYEEKGDFTHPNVDDKDLYDAEKNIKFKNSRAVCLVFEKLWAWWTGWH